jgi:hypothetical protein
MAIDRRTLRGTGALALYRRDGKFEVVATRPSGLDRPWARHYEAGEPRPAAPSPAARPEPDATPADADAEE